MLLQILTGFNYLTEIIQKGSSKNHLHYPHEDVRIFFEYLHPFNVLISELLEIEEEVKMYIKLLSALQAVEPSLKFEEGKRSSYDLIEVIKYFLVKIDFLLEHKAERDQKTAVYTEIDTFSLKLRHRFGTLSAH